MGGEDRAGAQWRPPEADVAFDAGQAERTLPEAFSAVVVQHAERVAVVDDSGEMSFAALDQRSGAVAAAIVALGCDRGPVAVLTAYGAHALVAVLGTARAGYIYVVLDSLAPNEHLQQGIERADVVALVVDDAHREQAAELADGLPIIVLERVPDARAPTVRISPGDPLSITFTSGSSGTPKALVHSHRNVVHNGLRFAAVIGAVPTDRFLVAMPLQFTAASTSVYTALLAGATGCYFALASRNVEGLIQFMHDRAITVAQFSPAHVDLLARHVSPLEPLANVRLVNIGGDRLDAARVTLIAEAVPRASILYRYSTSETNWVAGLVLDPGARPGGDDLPIGWPVPWVDVRVVDDAGREVAEGAAGELVVKSSYLALGYWGDELRTAERFQQVGDDRWYRSGDLVRRQSDGLLTHLGRKDRTLKVGGSLVDPVVIETCLATLPGVEQVMVIPLGDEHGAVRLAAFMTGRRHPPSVVRRHVAATLPRGMVPQLVISLDDLPLSARGKVDTAALRQLVVAYQRDEFDPPVEPTELAIARMYRDVLMATEVGRNDDFFELGGDSLATLELADEFANEFGVELELSTLLEHPTPEALAAWTRSASTQRRHVFRISSGSEDLAPVVWFAGWGGAGVHDLLPIIRSMAGRTSYVVFPHALEYRAVPDRTVARMAARALPELLDLDPAGRFAFVGRSSGGVVAIETAAQLEAVNVPPPLVVLLDTNGPGRPWSRRLRVNLARERAIPRRSALDRKYRQFRLLLAEVHWTFWSWTAGWIRRKGDAQRRAFKAVIHGAISRYQGRQYGGRVLLLRATKPLPEYHDLRRSLGWDELLTGDFEIVDVPGNHHDLASGDHLHSTLAALAAPLAEVDRRYRGGESEAAEATIPGEKLTRRSAPR